MNFRHGERDEPEINLIPFIDVLLVILIFLMLTTTFSQATALQVNLPQADAEPPPQVRREITVAVAADGRVAVQDNVLPERSVAALVAALRRAAEATPEPLLVIQADAAATHQAVVDVLDAARQAGLVQITFATQRSGP
ncbi:MAG: ExbD/TolR family protein [Tepidimonas ignava]|uniref:Biopolymer transport protein ExbD n=1 Tax=Tepidimonas ignava TaxID=114249 RepID=A0A4R3LFY5_9BURK|nr:biopolymer transporter ExbD [Tepidimonas ignava]TCS99013.1 biopolymer transport protein ExbD [Tepidimonas ignava]TSE22904.1 Biopolymer transport protein ExbD [Tepidimonas ignava]